MAQPFVALRAAAAFTMEDRKLKKRKFKMVENQNHSDAKLARMKEQGVPVPGTELRGGGAE